MENGWDSEWAEFKGMNFFGRLFEKGMKETVGRLLRQEGTDVSSTILDFGCGKGWTLHMLRSLGYANSKGFDVSPNAMILCDRAGFVKGKDVFLEKSTAFNAASYDMVFSDGVLEHFEDFTPISKEMCRIARRYVLITQPNHFSLYGRLLRLSGRKAVHEYTYRKKDFIEAFRKNGFILKRQASFNFGEQWAFLFERQASER